MNLTIVAINKAGELYKVWLARDVVETNFVDGKPVSETVRNEFAILLPADQVEGVSQKVFRDAVKTTVRALLQLPSTNPPAAISSEVGKTLSI